MHIFLFHCAKLFTVCHFYFSRPLFSLMFALKIDGTPVSAEIAGQLTDMDQWKAPLEAVTGLGFADNYATFIPREMPDLTKRYSTYQMLGVLTDRIIPRTGATPDVAGFLDLITPKLSAIPGILIY